MLKLLRRGKNKVDRILDQYELPSFSGPVMSVLSKLRDPETPLSEIATDLEIDPGLHVRVLRTVNSVAFGLSNKVSSLQHAVSLLGRSRLESLVLSVGVKEGLDRGRIPDWFDMRRFWLTAARRASLARGLAEIFHPQSQAEAFTAGLLQDMGVPVMATLKKDRYQELYKKWQSSLETDLADLEREAFELSHPQLGSVMARRWEFPSLLVEKVGNHHAAQQQEPDLAVHIASMIIDTPEAFDSMAFANHISDRTGLDRMLLENLLERVEEEATELAAALA